MPAPSVRQDWLWAKHNELDQLRERERRKACETLRQRCLANEKAEREQKVQQRRENEETWKAAQIAQLRAENIERSLSARIRGTSIVENEHKRLAARREAQEREASVHDNCKKLSRKLLRRECAESYHKQAMRHESKCDASESTHSWSIGWWRNTSEEKAREEAIRKMEREASEVAMRRAERADKERALKAEAESRRRAQDETARQIQRQKVRQAMRARLKAKEAEAGREANIHYLNTHGDKLHWDAPYFKHTLEDDGDGRWPFPMPPSKDFGGTKPRHGIARDRPDTGPYDS